MRCCDCEFRHKCDDTENVLTAFVKCYRREEFLKKSKKTNADRIRDMSDEELAKEFAVAGEFENRVCFCCEYFKCLQNKDGYCVYKHGRCNMDARLEAYKKWLQQPAEEE